MRNVLAIYDLGYYGPTFNIFEFLTSARIWQEEQGFNAIKLVILKRKINDSLFTQPQVFYEYDFRIQDILVAAANLFPLIEVHVTEDVAPVSALAQQMPDNVFPPKWIPELLRSEVDNFRFYLQKYIRDHVSGGGALPPISIPPFAFVKMRALLKKCPKPWISITVRMANHLPQKNSNPETWKHVEKHFRKQGGTVFVIPDILSIENFGNCHPISYIAVSNLIYRAALYDGCDLNLAVANGSTAPLWFNPSSVFLLAKFETPGTNTSREMNEQLLGICPGDLMWHKVPWQQPLWKDDDDPDEIISAGESLLSLSDDIRLTIKDNHYLKDPWGKADGSVTGFWQGIDYSQPRAVVLEQVKTRMSVKGFDDLLSVNQFSSKAWMAKAMRAQKTGDLAAALKFSKEAIKIDGRQLVPYFIAADGLKANNEPLLALAYLKAMQGLRGAD